MVTVVFGLVTFSQCLAYPEEIRGVPYLLWICKQQIGEIIEYLLSRLLTFTLCSVQETESWIVTSSKKETELTHLYHFSPRIGRGLIFICLYKKRAQMHMFFSVQWPHALHPLGTVPLWMHCWFDVLIPLACRAGVCWPRVAIPSLPSTEAEPSSGVIYVLKGTHPSWD